jgi:hypothetical protein
MDYVNSDKLIFVLANPGSGGYRLGRIVCCFDNVYWYETQNNGTHPWSLFFSDKIYGKNITPNHFDRTTKHSNIPLLGERIEKFWKSEDLEKFYTVKWTAVMARAKADEIINQGKSIVWVLHDYPEYLLSRFPNAKIINLIDTNLEETIDRYLETTALFPIIINTIRLKPTKGSHSEYTAALYSLSRVKKTPTYRDFWAWEYKNNSVYTDDMKDEYREYVSSLIYKRHKITNVESNRYLNVSWNTLDIQKIKEFIGATNIDENYVNLLK